VRVFSTKESHSAQRKGCFLFFYWKQSIARAEGQTKTAPLGAPNVPVCLLILKIFRARDLLIRATGPEF
jgi:hypothetical protein